MINGKRGDLKCMQKANPTNKQKWMKGGLLWYTVTKLKPQVENEWGEWDETNEMNDMKNRSRVKNQGVRPEVQQTKEGKNEWRGKSWA